MNAHSTAPVKEPFFGADKPASQDACNLEALEDA
jgi:hypothetical protein